MKPAHGAPLRRTVADVPGDDTLEVPGVEHKNVVEAFAAQRTDTPRRRGSRYEAAA